MNHQRMHTACRCQHTAWRGVACGMRLTLPDGGRGADPDAGDADRCDFLGAIDGRAERGDCSLSLHSLPRTEPAQSQAKLRLLGVDAGRPPNQRYHCILGRFLGDFFLPRPRVNGPGRESIEIVKSITRGTIVR